MARKRRPRMKARDFPVSWQDLPRADEGAEGYTPLHHVSVSDGRQAAILTATLEAEPRGLVARILEGRSYRKHPLPLLGHVERVLVGAMNRALLNRLTEGEFDPRDPTLDAAVVDDEFMPLTPLGQQLGEELGADMGEGPDGVVRSLVHLVDQMTGRGQRWAALYLKRAGKRDDLAFDQWERKHRFTEAADPVSEEEAQRGAARLVEALAGSGKTKKN